jgi:Tfp pilus assembly protein PilE
VSAAAVIGLPSGRLTRLGAKLRDEKGIGLVELLIALLVLNIGIFATFAAFTSGALALRRASHISTAAAIADKQMEAFRNTKYSLIAAIPLPGALVTGADGRSYTLTASVSPGSQKTGVTYPGSGSVELVTINVYDGAPGTGGQLLNTSTSTFSRCNQSGLGGDTGQTPCQS